MSTVDMTHEARLQAFNELANQLIRQGYSEEVQRVAARAGQHVNKRIDAVRTSLIEHFGGINEVSAIYLQWPQVWIFTSNPTYNDALMDTLLWVEEDCFQQQYLGMVFRYIPDVLVGVHSDVVGDILPIYRREAATIA